MVMQGFVALISGGKDSIFNIMECVAHGYKLEVVVNLSPTLEGSYSVEMDSYMYQSVANEGVRLIADALQVPLYQFPISGKPHCQRLQYEMSANDEVEDLFQALSKVKADFPAVRFVSSGAILSDYQRIRVEHVATRVGLLSLAFLWQVPTDHLIRAMISASLDAVIVKIASYGLEPKRHLGAHLSAVVSSLRALSEPPWSLNICGEGGEYESFTLDCPLFHRRIQLRSPPQIVYHSDDESYPVAYLHLTHIELEDKPEESVCTSATDLLCIEGQDPLSSELSPLRPFLSPVERLRDLEQQLINEVKDDVKRVRPQSVSWSPCRHSETELSTTYDEPGFQSLANGSLLVTTVCAGIQKPSNDNHLEVLDPLIRQVTRLAIGKLRDQLGFVNLNTDHIVHNLVVLNQSLTDEVFAAFNEEYVTEFGLPWEQGDRKPQSDGRLFPPTRACISVNCLLGPDKQYFESSSSVAISLTAILHPSPPNQPSALTGLCRGLHVRSISHWAPANIGPYSQALAVPCPAVSSSISSAEDENDGTDNIQWTFYSGQIGLIPETLALPQFDGEVVEDVDQDAQWDKSLRTQCFLALRHCHRTLRAMSSVVWNDLAAGLCYGTSYLALRCARHTFHTVVCTLWSKSLTPSLDEDPPIRCFCESHVAWLLVSDLPKQASVEWQFVTRSPSLDQSSPPFRYGSCSALATSFPSLIFCPMDHLRRQCVTHPAIPVVGLLNQSDMAVGLFL